MVRPPPVPGKPSTISAVARRQLPFFGLLVASTSLAGCHEAAVPAAEPRPVRSIVVARRAVEEPVVLTGQIEPQDEVSLAFRVGGRVIERSVDVGTPVRAGMVVARIDPRPGEDDVRSAEASLAGARAQLVQARNTYDRQNTLLAGGYTTRVQFDQAQQQLQSAQSQVDSQGAQLHAAQDRLGYAELRADSSGTVTATGVASGEVVAAGQMVVRIALRTDLDAVFEVPAALIRAAPRDIPVALTLTDDPTIRAAGHVREVAPQANPVTRTYKVKVGLIDPPTAMRLGAIVVGSVRLPSDPVIVVPAAALTQSEGKPAVWVVEGDIKRVALRSVAVRRYEQGGVVLASGVEIGDVVVTAGVQALHPGQVVRLLGEPS